MMLHEMRVIAFLSFIALGAGIVLLYALAWSIAALVARWRARSRPLSEGQRHAALNIHRDSGRSSLSQPSSRMT